MKLLSKLFVPAFLLSITFQAQAQVQTLSYSFVELGYNDTTLDFNGSDVDGDGFYGAASYEVSNSIFIGASIGSLSYDFDIDQDVFELGIGAHTPLSRQTDLYGTVSYLDAEVSQRILGTTDDSGYALAVGIRHLLTDTLEISGAINYVDIFNDDSTGLNLEARYYFGDVISTALAYATTDNADGLSLSIRINF